jgi:hypothetical protein
VSQNLAATARAYWETYLPARYATIQDPETFFADLAGQVREQVAVAAMDAVGTLPETPDSRARTAALQGARDAATQAAMRDLVLLPPEPGTEHLRQAGHVLPGWDDPQTAPETPTSR